MSVALRLLRRHAPHLKWVLTFADATRSGDGCIYRASGFLLTGIRANNTVWSIDGHQFTDLDWKDCGHQRRLLSRLALQLCSAVAA